MNVDLSFSPEEATKRLGRAVDDAVDRLRRLGEELAQDLKSITIVTAADVVALKEAERAIVQDFEIRHTRASRIGLTLDCGMGSYPVELSTALGEGDYRALILISRRK